MNNYLIDLYDNLKVCFYCQTRLTGHQSIRFCATCNVMIQIDLMTEIFAIFFIKEGIAIKELCKENHTSIYKKSIFQFKIDGIKLNLTKDRVKKLLSLK